MVEPAGEVLGKEEPLFGEPAGEVPASVEAVGAGPEGTGMGAGS